MALPEFLQAKQITIDNDSAIGIGDTVKYGKHRGKYTVVSLRPDSPELMGALVLQLKSRYRVIFTNPNDKLVRKI